MDSGFGLGNLPKKAAGFKTIAPCLRSPERCDPSPRWTMGMTVLRRSTVPVTAAARDSTPQNDESGDPRDLSRESPLPKLRRHSLASFLGFHDDKHRSGPPPELRQSTRDFPRSQRHPRTTPRRAKARYHSPFDCPIPQPPSEVLVRQGTHGLATSRFPSSQQFGAPFNRSLPPDLEPVSHRNAMNPKSGPMLSMRGRLMMNSGVYPPSRSGAWLYRLVFGFSPLGGALDAFRDEGSSDSFPPDTHLLCPCHLFLKDTFLAADTCDLNAINTTA